MCLPELEFYRVESASRKYFMFHFALAIREGGYDSEHKLVRIGASVSLLPVLAGTPGLADGVRV